jgi:hypothetical protein
VSLVRVFSAFERARDHAGIDPMDDSLDRHPQATGLARVRMHLLGLCSNAKQDWLSGGVPLHDMVKAVPSDRVDERRFRQARWRQSYVRLITDCDPCQASVAESSVALPPVSVESRYAVLPALNPRHRMLPASTGQRAGS